MYSRWILAGAALSTVASSRGFAQGALASQCAAQSTVAADACQKAVDLFDFMAPQLGVTITGGSAVMGGAGTLGGFPHLTVGARVNLIGGQVPQMQNVPISVTGAQRSNLAPDKKILGLPTAEAALGLWKGVNIGATNVAGVDAIVSAFFVPNIDADQVTVRTEGSKVQLGYGVRVGILQETTIIPGIAVSFLRRDMPTVNMHAAFGASDSVRLDGLKAKTSAWRAAISKNILVVQLTGGIGQDRYDSHATASAFVRQSPGFNGKVADVSQKMTRTNFYGGAAFNLWVLKIAAEAGHATGGSAVEPFNSFAGKKANDSYNYGSVGVRFGL